MSNKKVDFIYLDNNATTRVCDSATALMTDWIQRCSNISSSNALGQAGRDLVDKAQRDIDKLCNLKGEYHIIFTSGASESNCTIIHMVVDAWHKNIKTVPHIVASAIEHKSIVECLHQLEDAGRVEVTWVQPDLTGDIAPEDVEAAIKKNTALVTVMFANNELGTINQVRQIGEVAHRHKVPFHTDAVQIFGKLRLDIPAFNIDALSMCFHKMYGPTGIGLLIIRKTFVAGYKLQSQIAGSQQSGLRGGTENLPAIAGAVGAIVDNFRRRREKNAQMERLRTLLITLLTKELPRRDYGDFYAEEKPQGRGLAICILGTDVKNCHLPNTILLSIVDFDHQFCNVKFKKALEVAGIIVSIGSACNTSSKSASHVLDAILAPAIIKRGVLRVSLSDNTTVAEIHEFARTFLKMVGQCHITKNKN